MHLARAARRRRLVNYPCNYEKSYVPVPITVKHSVQQVNADRDVNQKSKAINWRGRARTLLTLESVRHGILLARGEGKSRVFRGARRRPRSESVIAFFSLLLLASWCREIESARDPYFQQQ